MNQPKTRDLIVVFTSIGGGGHLAAAEAVKEALGENHDIEVFNALSDVFSRVDWISKFSNKKLTGERTYNFFLKKRFFLLANAYGIAGLSYMRLQKKTLVQAAIDFLKKKKPKMIVSVIPYFNGAIQEACRELNIPFWIIPTDLELKTFIIGLKKTQLISSHFKLVLAYKPQVQQALKWGIPKSNILKIGFPVKKACLKQYRSKEILDIKRALGIKGKSKVITLTLGATGTTLFFKILKGLASLDYGHIEFICVAGRDERSFSKAKKYLDEHAHLEPPNQNHLVYKLASGSRLHLLGFVNNLPEIMAISHLVVAKTGSLSVNEALHLQKYLLLDHTLNSSSRVLFWERPNVAFVKSMKQGEGFFSKKDLLEKINKFLNNPKDYCREVFLNIHQNLPLAVKEWVG
jgi:processive 1,2-diacylglycerol beta-glucosyltransferase